jgi:hypothetical protein
MTVHTAEHFDGSPCTKSYQSCLTELEGVCAMNGSSMIAHCKSNLAK